ncbi:MAG: hypothetical protein IH591_19185, partial [Bacteroidales bacterium]|nr:hypothetical protein [Bacteroidales bacterium]
YYACNERYGYMGCKLARHFDVDNFKRGVVDTEGCYVDHLAQTAQ